MIIYSEILDKKFDTVEECEQEEKLYEEEQKKKAEEARLLKEERAARAKEVDEAFKRIKMAQDEYNKILKKFIEDYGSYHSTYTSPKDALDIFEIFKFLP